MPGRGRVAAGLAGVAGTVVGVAWRVAPGVVGLGLVAYGAWLAWPPAGFLAAGGLLLADQVAGRLRGERRRG